jgi:hypothetical protein
MPTTDRSIATLARGPAAAAMLAVMLGLAAALAACGSKRDDAGTGSGSADKPSAAAPMTCPPGNAVKDHACVPAITPQQIAAVAKQQSRIDEVSRLLDQIDAIAAPIELFGGIRQLDSWKAVKARSAKVAALDAVADSLDGAVKALRTFQASLGDASARLGNLKGELDRLLAEPGPARRIEELRAEVSTDVRAALEPLAAQVQAVVQDAIVPLSTQLGELSDVVISGCTMAKLSGGDKLKELCTQARDAFAKALVALGDVKQRPARLFLDVAGDLEAGLGSLVDDKTRKLLDRAQAKIDDALRLPHTGSAAATGSAH